jgi:RNA polymerase sigma-70 factor (ECF subfamily)
MQMKHPPLSDQISQKYDMYGGMIYKLSYILLCNKSDAEDAVQETFIRYIKKPQQFDSSEHERAWFIRVATNVCRDKLRFRLRHKTVPLHNLELYSGESDESDILERILALPAKCKAPLYMHYVEGYSIREIAKILKSGESTVKSWLLRGRQKLRLVL